MENPKTQTKSTFAGWIGLIRLVAMVAAAAWLLAFSYSRLVGIDAAEFVRVGFLAKLLLVSAAICGIFWLRFWRSNQLRKPGIR
jgi:hypothetical protein